MRQRIYENEADNANGKWTRPRQRRKPAQIYELRLRERQHRQRTRQQHARRSVV